MAALIAQIRLTRQLNHFQLSRNHLDNFTGPGNCVPKCIKMAERTHLECVSGYPTALHPSA